MGNKPSIPENHMRIYKNLLAIQSPVRRVEVIETLLASPEIVGSFKAAGLYGHILHYKTQVARGAAARLPGEGVGAAAVEDVRRVPSGGESRVVVHSGGHVVRAGGWTHVDQKTNEQAISYFSKCLRVLDLEDEVSLTEETLKAAYRKAGKRAHPDKGGNEQEFEAVTRAYDYLLDLLRRMTGGRMKTSDVTSPQMLQATRGQDADKWKHVEPVKLNPTKLDMNAFNKMYEQTRMATPDDDGYGDWLKAEESQGKQIEGVKKFSGKFNRDLFNKTFQDEVGREGGQSRALAQVQPLPLGLSYGDELGVEKRESFTAAANEALQYTDLKQAYTKENTFSQNVAGIQISARSISQLEAERSIDPTITTHEEQEMIQRGEAELQARENARQQRMQQRARQEQEYFDRMKRLVLTNN
jgi:curved DNA-binding protein CbpA